MWVKICANTTLADALAAAEAGADAIGFVFAPSKRQVSSPQVREIAAGLPSGVERVGVFGSLPAEEIAAAALHARLTGVQLHGGFDAATSARLAELLGPEVVLIQTVHWAIDRGDRAAGEVELAFATLEDVASHPRVLLDAKLNGASGGLGVSFDWHSAGDVLTRHPGVRTILAGGLRPETVVEAIHTVGPYGVDVASGVERSPGIKDHEKVREFIRNARGA